MHLLELEAAAAGRSAAVSSKSTLTAKVGAAEIMECRKNE